MSEIFVDKDNLNNLINKTVKEVQTELEEKKKFVMKKLNIFPFLKNIFNKNLKKEIELIDSLLKCLEINDFDNFTRQICFSDFAFSGSYYNVENKILKCIRIQNLFLSNSIRILDIKKIENGKVSIKYLYNNPDDGIVHSCIINSSVEESVRINKVNISSDDYGINIVLPYEKAS